MTSTHLTLFGGFSAHRNNLQEPIHLRTDKIRALLAYLAVEADRPHRRDTLATLFWPTMSDSIAKRNLRQSLHRMKQAIALPDGWIEMTRQTVMLHGTQVASDVTQFEQIIHACEVQQQDQPHTNEKALKQLNTAVQLYSGEFLQGIHIDDALGFTEWLTVRRERYHQQTLTALHLLSDACLRRKSYDKANGYAQKQLRLEPWQESAHRQAIRAFAFQGQRAAAFAQFERCKTVLQAELGVSVSAETAHLHSQLLANSLNSHQTDKRTHHHNFPVRLTPFIGRQSDIDTLIAHLTQTTCRLLSVIASGGMGKTRLAIEAATALAEQTHLFQDGLYFVSLAAINSPELLATAIGTQLGMRFLVSSTPQEQLLSYLYDRDCLLVLDNFEHIIVAKQLVAEIIQTAPAVKLIVTSREALNLHAEQRLILDGLVKAEAMQLFTQSARRTQPSFTVSAENQPALHQICQVTGGLPLALEMAASWTRLLSCEQIATQIANHNAAFLENRADLPDRHRSVRAVFDHSWALLNSAERNTLAQLAIFRDGMTLDAILAITDATLNEIANLLDKSLITKQATRFAHHPLLRQLAAEKLVANSSQQQVATRHADFYAQFLQTHFADIQLNKPAVLQRVSAELGNIDAAWRFALTHKQVTNITISYRPLATFYELTHRYSEWISSFQFAVAQIDAQPASFLDQHPLVLAGILGRYATALENEAVYNKAYEAAQRSLAIATAHNLAAIIPQTTLALGRIQYFLGEMQAAESTLHEAVAWSKKMHMQYELADALDFLATALLSLGKTDESITIFSEAQTLATQIGDTHVLMLVTSALGFIASIKGEYERAWFYWHQVLAFEELCENNLLYGRLHNYISLQYVTQNKFALAQEASDRGHKALKNLTFTRVYFDTQCARALIAAFLGNFDLAWEIERNMRRIAKTFVATAATRNRRAETVRGILLFLSGNAEAGLALLASVQSDPTTGWENLQLIKQFRAMLNSQTTAS
ncbi:MAG: BTAD domain-containing putative transcriptional regulator [Candidatus Promineifilaceae bacterium]